MTFAEKLKSIRKQAGLSQETLAEKLQVSRQAVTKWETDAGVPDIANLMAISSLFGVSLDELLSNETRQGVRADFRYESVTEYDIDGPKCFDLNLGGVSRLFLRGYDGEKMRVRLASDTLSTVDNDFKVKIDDGKKRIDVDVVRKNGMTEAIAKKAVTLFVCLPNRYLNKLEVSINAECVEMCGLQCESIELGAKIRGLTLDGVIGTVEIDCNSDMDIDCRTLNGAVEINQLSATSRIRIPQGAPFVARLRGIGTSISYEREGKSSEPFCVREADNVIELNGMKSELVICS